MGAPLGNQNARKGKFAEAVESAVHVEDPITRRRKLHSIAEKLVQMAESGDMQAIKEVGDRLDGKPKQQIEATGANEGPIQIVVTSDVSGVV